MSLTPIHKGNDPLPFWGDNSSYIGGRDPLAVQNSSVVIYSSLIIGITNVTTRVRYNGFYCWLLELINRKLCDLKLNANSLENQILYLRRAELLIAYTMTADDNLRKVTGIGGTDYTRREMILDENIDLSHGADSSFGLRNTYWSNPLGIFGQYYIGVLVDLGLICAPKDKIQVYRTTKKGIDLANTFGKSLSSEAKEVFWNSIYSGKVSFDTLATFNPMALNNIQGDELTFYRNILYGPDYGNDECTTINRKETIKLILKYINTHSPSLKNIVEAFLEDNFHTILSKHSTIDDVSLSWFLYELNELTHAAFESFHFGLLYSLQETPQSLEIIIQQLTNEVMEIASLDKIVLLDDFDLSLNPHTIYTEMWKCKIGKENARRIFLASHLLCILRDIIKPFRKQIDKLAKERNYLRNGYALDLLDYIFDLIKNNDFKKFVINTLYLAINIHQSSSYAKSGIGQRLVHNYMIDNNVIWRMRNTVPTRTSPRITNLLLYMRDLQWIELDEDDIYHITPEGTKLINND